VLCDVLNRAAEIDKTKLDKTSLDQVNDLSFLKVEFAVGQTNRHLLKANPSTDE